MTKVEAVAADKKSFRDFCVTAVTDFLQTIVVVDDSPHSSSIRSTEEISEAKVAGRPTVLKGVPGLAEAVAKPLAPETPTSKAASATAQTATGDAEEATDSKRAEVASGAAGEPGSPQMEDAAKTEEKTASKADDERRHDFDFKKVTKAFSEHGLICGSYYPEMSEEDETITENAFRIAKNSDVLVIDWHLVKRPKNPAKPTIDTIRNLLSEDMSNRGRLRLILIYTGEDIAGLPKRLAEALKEPLIPFAQVVTISCVLG